MSVPFLLVLVSIVKPSPGLFFVQGAQRAEQ